MVEFVLVEVPTPCGGKPEVVGEKTSGDDGDGFFGVSGEEGVLPRGIG